jgi:hypothetical protein
MASQKAGCLKYDEYVNGIQRSITMQNPDRGSDTVKAIAAASLLTAVGLWLFKKRDRESAPAHLIAGFDDRPFDERHPEYAHLDAETRALLDIEERGARIKMGSELIRAQQSSRHTELKNIFSNIQ